MPAEKDAEEDATNANIYKPSSALKGNSVYLLVFSRLFSARRLNGTEITAKRTAERKELRKKETIFIE